VGYVVDRLNKIFNYNWNFYIVERTIGKKQIEVRGRLVGSFYHTPSNQWRDITKEQFGGIDIKFNRQSGEPVSIADDLKAAASDALKKCASQFGIAQDLYWMGGSEFSENLNEEFNVDDVPADLDAQEHPKDDDVLYCATCGEIAYEKSGVAKTGKKWHAIFCSSEDKSHVQWLN
jgi:hypothetical protein